MNAANLFKDQRRPLSRLLTVMFRGTPCRLVKDMEDDFQAVSQLLYRGTPTKYDIQKSGIDI